MKKQEVGQIIPQKRKKEKQTHKQKCKMKNIAKHKTYIDILI